MLSEDVEWHVPGRSPIAGSYEGRDAVLAYFEKRRDMAEATFQIETRDVLANDHRVVILADGTAERSGRALAWQTVGLFTVLDGKITSGRLLPFDQAEFDAIWT